MTETDTDTNNENKRAAPISYRPPAALRAAFHERVERSGLSTNAFITRAVFGAGTTPETTQLARLLSETAQISDTLHDIALSGGDNAGNTLRLDAALSDLTEIRAGILTALRRRP